MDFKQYNEEKEYIYPSFSLIFVNPFIDAKLKKYGEGVNARTYSQFLEGQLWDDRMLNISYDDVTIDMADYFLGYDIMLANLDLKSYNNFGDDGREDANNTVVILDNSDIGDAKNVDGTDVDDDDLHDLALALR